LIFVIVIIGILAAVAIPKLAATRDDAKIAEMIANSRTVLGDLSAYYTAQGSTAWTDVNGTVASATNVNLLGSDCLPQDANATELSPNDFYLCNGTAQCLQFNTQDAGILTISDGSDTTDVVCEGVQTDSAMITIKKAHQFGGSRVQR